MGMDDCGHSHCRTTQRRGSNVATDRKSTRLNSSHSQISYAVFCLKKKKIKNLHAVGDDVRSSVARRALFYRVHSSPAQHRPLDYYMRVIRYDVEVQMTLM